LNNVIQLFIHKDPNPCDEGGQLTYPLMQYLGQDIAGARRIKDEPQGISPGIYRI
jgi:hypothetical protein